MLRIHLFAASLSALAQAPCATEAFQRYDYVVGEWAVTRDGKPVGNVRYRKAVHGCAIVEDYTGPGGISRKGLLYFDPRASRWEIIVAGTDGLLEGHETSPDVFTADGASFRLAKSGDGWSIGQEGAWKQVYNKSPYPATSSDQTRHCDSPEQRQFDFWLGKWDVFNPRGALAGTNHIYSAARGCALVENWTAGAGFSTGISLNFWDVNRSAWRQVWVAPGGALKVQGKWDGSVLRFASAVSQLTFTPNKDGTVRQYWEQTTDSGKTWSVAFDGTYRRAKERTREDLLADLESSERATLAMFQGVSEEQSRFRQAEGQWTLREILDHLRTTEAAFHQHAKKLSEATTDESVSGFDPGFIEPQLGAALRAPEPLLPNSADKPLAELIARYRQQREATKAMVRTASLRGFRGVHPLGGSNLDAYQWLFTMVAHNRRHLEQASEVLADPRYPGALSGLRRWSGTWKGAGKFNGQAVDAELYLNQLFGGHFDELHITIKLGPGRTFEGRAVYGADNKATWSDSNGNAYPVFGKWIDGKLIADWGDPIRGRSTYGLAADGALEVVDEVKRPDGSFAIFGKYRLNKQLVNESTARYIRRLTRFDSDSLSTRAVDIAIGAKEESAIHDRDEVYYVEAGRGVLEAGTQQIPVQPGSVVHVRRGVPRRFHSVEQPLKILLVSGFR